MSKNYCSFVGGSVQACTNTGNCCRNNSQGYIAHEGLAIQCCKGEIPVTVWITALQAPPHCFPALLTFLPAQLLLLALCLWRGCLQHKGKFDHQILISLPSFSLPISPTPAQTLTFSSSILKRRAGSAKYAWDASWGGLQARPSSSPSTSPLHASMLAAVRATGGIRLVTI